MANCKLLAELEGSQETHRRPQTGHNEDSNQIVPNKRLMFGHTQS